VALAAAREEATRYHSMRWQLAVLAPVAVPAAPPTVPASIVQDEHVAASSHRDEGDTEPVAVPAAPPTVPASIVQDEHVAASGLFSRVIAKIRHH
jgi:hypothetical protein